MSALAQATLFAHTRAVNPYQPPAPGLAPLPPASRQPPSQTRLIVWLVLSALSLCSCGVLAIAPIVLSVIALVKAEKAPDLSWKLHRAAILCVLLGAAFFLVAAIYQLVVVFSGY